MKQVKVCGVTYDVEWDKEIVIIDGDAHYIGSCDQNNTKIEILNELSQERKNQVFVHELTHAMLNEANYKEHDEELVERLSIILHQVLKDNDFNWIRNNQSVTEVFLNGKVVEKVTKNF